MFGRKKEKIKRTRTRFISNYTCVMLRKENGVFVEIGRKKITNKDEFFSFENKSFPVKNLSVAYKDKRHNYLFFDFDGQIINFSGQKLPLPSTDIYDLVTKKVISGLLSIIRGSLDTQDIKGKLIGYIVVGIMGGAIGYIVATQIV